MAGDSLMSGADEPAQDIVAVGAADFEEFAASRWPGLVRLARGLTDDRRLAEDLAQTALARVCASWWRLRRAADPDASLHRALINSSNRRFRRRRVIGQPGGDPPQLPLNAITRRARSIRRRRAGMAIAAAGTAAAAGFVLAPHQPAPARTSHASGASHARGAPVVTNTRSIGAGNVFANGATGGKAWRLSVANVADDGKACLPAVVLDGQYADPLPARAGTGPPPIGAPSVISDAPSAPMTTFTFFRVQASVTALRVTIGMNPPLTLVPATETECGQTFRLVGYGSPVTAQVTVTPVSSSATAPELVFASANQPSSTSLVAWNWQNPDTSAGWGTWRTIARATVDGSAWEVWVAVGPFGECFSVSWRSGQLSDTIACAPVMAPGANSVVAAWSLPDGSPVDGWAVPVGPGVVRVEVKLANGTSLRATPVDAGGRRYVAGLTTTSPVASITAYNAAGNVAEVCGPIQYMG
jgi:DNA-directed RNA polymerase specialized sigma24 family protein